MDTTDVAGSTDKYAQIDVRYSDVHIGERSNERPEVVNGDNAKPPFEIENGKEGNVKHHKVVDDDKKIWIVRKGSEGKIEKILLSPETIETLRTNRKISVNKVPSKTVEKRTKGSESR